MPYNRFSYEDLSAQINVLSHLAVECFNQSMRGPVYTTAATLIGSRIRTEIDRLNRHRKKMKQYDPNEDTTDNSAFAETTFTPQNKEGTGVKSHG